MMPIQLRIIAICLAVFFFFYTIRLVRRDKAEIRHMYKWLFLAIVLLVGSIFSEAISNVAHVLGVRTLTSFALFILVGVLLMICLRYQISLISADKQIRRHIQEISLMKKRLDELENKDK